MSSSVEAPLAVCSQIAFQPMAAKKCWCSRWVKISELNTVELGIRKGALKHGMQQMLALGSFVSGRPCGPAHG